MRFPKLVLLRGEEVRGEKTRARSPVIFGEQGGEARGVPGGEEMRGGRCDWLVASGDVKT